MTDEEWERRLQETMKLIKEGEEELYGKCECDVQAGVICDVCIRRERRKKVGLHCGSGSA